MPVFTDTGVEAHAPEIGGLAAPPNTP